MTTRTRTALAVLTLSLLAAGGATSCARTERWCELDRGDVVVDNSYCERNVPGYEWEPDHDKPKYKKKPKKSSH
ncbi:hypothetical protein ACWEVD_07285 [Nocardia thailandica]|uniref:Lipoprotein n=1 Tax=Nocardia thailandica TaxID=257275 RepID=A0ABW6PRM5_9NOCA|nr:hypothetical protein [Nocardia thailandica]